MNYTIKNDHLSVTVSTHGAEVVSAVNLHTGDEMLWCADPEIWNRHAPILFPYVGRLKDGAYTLDGCTFSGGSHGFARDSEFELLEDSGEKLAFRLLWNPDTLLKFPRKFSLLVVYTLDGETLRQELTVTNLDDREMSFGLGYHPGFTLPFDDKHTTKDYELRFDTPQTPEEVLFEEALMTENSRPYMEKGLSIPLDDRMFDNDSIFLKGLSAKTVSLTEKDTGRFISIDLTEFPYFVFWSSLGQEKLHFLCLEPWYSHPDMLNADREWRHKSNAATLQPGNTFVSHLNITFHR